MDKIAMYKEEIYKQAGIGNAFKNFAENAKDALKSTSWGVNRENAKRLAQETKSGGNAFKSNFSSAKPAESTSLITHPLAQKYNINGVKSKAEVDSIMKKELMKNHPDRFRTVENGVVKDNQDKMKDINERFRNVKDDYDNLKNSSFYSKLAYYLENNDVEKIAEMMLNDEFEKEGV